MNDKANRPAYRQTDQICPFRLRMKTKMQDFPKVWIRRPKSVNRYTTDAPKEKDTSKPQIDEKPDWDT